MFLECNFEEAKMIWGPYISLKQSFGVIVTVNAKFHELQGVSSFD